MKSNWIINFDYRFAKTEEYGYSLMDAGAPCFVVMNGIVDSRNRKKRFVVFNFQLITVPIVRKAHPS